MDVGAQQSGWAALEAVAEALLVGPPSAKAAAAASQWIRWTHTRRRRHCSDKVFAQRKLTKEPKEGRFQCSPRILIDNSLYSLSHSVHHSFISSFFFSLNISLFLPLYALL